jgi:acyl carrier protein
MSTVQDRVAEIVAEHLGIDQEEIASDSPFATDLGLDSLDQAGLLLEFEKAFCVRFPPGSADQIQSVGEVVALIETARAA